MHSHYFFIILVKYNTMDESISAHNSIKVSHHCVLVIGNNGLLGLVLEVSSGNGIFVEAKNGKVSKMRVYDGIEKI